MAQRQQSSAAITRVKGVSFNFLQFMWKRLDKVAEAREQGNYTVALKLISELIVWLPASMKEEFLTRSLNITKSLNMIRSNAIPELIKITDIHQRMAKRNWLLAAYSSAALTSFINDLTSKLDALGYMENTKTVTEGDTDGTGAGMDWSENYLKDTDKGKSRGKRGKMAAAPTGSVVG